MTGSSRSFPFDKYEEICYTSGMRYALACTLTAAHAFFLAGCTPDLPVDHDFSQAIVTLYSSGKPSQEIPVADNPELAQRLTSWWKQSAHHPGMLDYITYAPDIIIQTEKLSIYLQKHRTVLNIKKEDHSVWLQYSRAATGQDEALRSGLQELGEKINLTEKKKKSIH